MREWREYYSENPGGHWIILSDEKQPEKQEDMISTSGSKAVIVMKRKPGDYISVNIISASKEVDSVTGKVGGEKDFYLMLSCLRDGWSCISNTTYKADEVLALSKIFIGLTKKNAIKIWKLKKLGLEGNRIEL